MSEQIDQQIPRDDVAHDRRRSAATRSSPRRDGCSPTRATRRRPTRSRARPASRSPTSCGCSAPSASCSSRRTARRRPRSWPRSARCRPGPDAGAQMADAYVGLLDDRNLLRLTMHGFIAGADDEVGKIARHTLGEAFRLFQERTGADDDDGPPVRRPGHAHQRAARRRRARPHQGEDARHGRAGRCASRRASPSGAPRDPDGTGSGPTASAPSDGRPRRTASSSSTSPPAGPATTWSRGCAGSPARARSGTPGRSTRWRPGSSSIGIGRATRLLTYIVGADKEYTATIRLGVSTTTDDAEGETLAVTDASGVTARRWSAGVAALTGDIQQVPSAVSAIKVDGQRAYARVRAGEDVELAARPVTVSRFDVHDVRRADGVRRRRRDRRGLVGNLRPCRSPATSGPGSASGDT